MLEFFAGNEKLLTLGGYAGCGKTFLIADTMNKIPDRPPIAFCTLAAKAASVLKVKLNAAGALREDVDYCGTIHGLIYETERVKQTGVLDVKTDEKDEVAVRQPHTEGTRQEISWRSKSIDSEYGLIVIDEASMVSGEIFADLEDLGIPILAVGDHGQLPPIGGSFNLMENPMIRLEKIHRQADGDPIIRISMMAREQGHIQVSKYSDDVEKIQGTGDRSFAARATRETMFLCGTNATRVWWNNHLREKFGFKDHDPQVGERVICLKNNHQTKVYNGETGIVRHIENHGKHWYWMVATMDSGVEYSGTCLKHQFGSVSNLYNFTENGRPMAAREIGDLFDWGYCFTTWKAQGSEADDVIFLEERQSRMDDDMWRRFLYTSVTRAKKRLLIVGS